MHPMVYGTGSTWFLLCSITVMETKPKTVMSEFEQEALQ